MKKIVAIIAVMFGISMFAYAQMNQNQTVAEGSNAQMQNLAPSNDALQNKPNTMMKTMPDAANADSNAGDTANANDNHGAAAKTDSDDGDDSDDSDDDSDGDDSDDSEDSSMTDNANDDVQ